MDAKEFMGELAERIEDAANVKAVFGEPIGEGMDIIIPVARVTIRGGGGGGIDAPRYEGNKSGKGRGMGLGMNITISPVGYIRWRSQGPEFVPIIDQNRALIGVAGLALAGVLLARMSWRAAHRSE